MLKNLIIALIAFGGNSLLAEDQNSIVDAAKAQDLSQSAMKMGQSIYEQEQAKAASDAPTDGAAAGSEGGSEEEVVDAEFSEVDEDAKN